MIYGSFFWPGLGKGVEKQCQPVLVRMAVRGLSPVGVMCFQNHPCGAKTSIKMRDHAPVLGRGLQMLQTGTSAPRKPHQGLPGGRSQRWGWMAVAYLYLPPSFRGRCGSWILPSPTQPRPRRWHSWVSLCAASPFWMVARAYRPPMPPQGSVALWLSEGRFPPLGFWEVLAWQCLCSWQRPGILCTPGQIPPGTVGCIPRLVGSETPAALGLGVLFRLLGQVSPP